MSKWKTYRLGEICNLVAGFAFKSNHFGNYANQVIKIADIQPPIVKKELMGVDLSTYDANKLKKYIVSRGDFVLAMTGATIGKIGRVTNDTKAYINQRVLTFRPNPLIIDKSYLYYLLSVEKFNKYILNHIDSETAQPNISANSIGGYEISLPPLAEQKRIADILSAIDDKIELNRRINANLEQQAQALYKEWFVAVEKDNWEEKRLGDIIELYDSQRRPLSGQQRANMDKIYPYYGAASLMDYVDNYLFDGIYLLLGEDGTVSDSEGFPMLQYVWGKFWVNNHAHILQGKNGYTTESLYILLKQTNVSSIITGAVQPKISQANLKSIPIKLPPIELLSNYNKIIKPLFEEIRNNSTQINQLSTLRDTLLPKLMSGEIKV